MSDWSDGIALSETAAESNSAANIVSMAGNAVGAAFGMPFVGSLVSGLFGKKGAKDTNSAQDARQIQAQQFDAQQAQLNRDFQERMSGTAYQRAMGDMRTAGLNPVLAYSQGGASTPSGSTASSPTPAPVINKTAAGIDAAQRTLASAQQAASIKNIDADTSKKHAETINTDIDTRLRLAEFRDDPAPGSGGTFQQEALRLSGAKLNQEMHNLITSNRLTDAQIALVKQELANAEKTNRLIQANTGNREADTVILKYRAAQEKAISELWEVLGGAGKAVEAGVSTAGSAIGSLFKLRRLFGR